MIALTTFLTGVIQYVRQGHQTKATYFLDMRRRFLEIPLFSQILTMLAVDSPDLRNIPVQDRRNFIGFLEEVALMVNSKMIRPEVAYYMFGYYVYLASKSENLWDNLDRNSQYWTLFRSFADRMAAMAKEKPVELEALRL